jgi:uncharacterized alkaline shock family protein YloU
MADFENEQQPAISSRQQAQAGVYGLPPTSRQGRAEETLMDAQGKTTISDGVVAKVAGIAASEIDGVHELVSPGAAGKAMSGLARVTGGDTRASGVRVEVGEREAAVDMNMVVDYGVSIPQVASAIRHNITNRVWEMTGLKVKEVNIGVTDIYFPQMEQSSQQARVQ